MTFLVTGAAGFIGFHCARALLHQGVEVVGMDNLNPYYSVDIKRGRLAELEALPGFTFRHVDIADFDALRRSVEGRSIERVIHLAAQPGVRYSIANPHAFVASNLTGFVNMLELCRHSDRFEHMIYASSSSVYGGNTKLPFSESDPVDNPISLYAATKRADELMSHTYSHLYGMRLTGLRFFTVYGPWGRPDMAVWGFTEAILAGRPIPVFNGGHLKRDFTFVDDIAAGVLAIAKGPIGDDGRKHRIYNIGNNRPEDLMQMIGLLEEALGRRAIKEYLPAQPGDLTETCADITAIQTDYGYRPSTPISVGIPAFARWYMDHFGIAAAA